MDADDGPAWPLMWSIPWRSARMGEDDRTVTVNFGADFGENELRPVLTALYSRERVTIRLQLVPDSPSRLAACRSGPGAPDHTAELVLRESIRGRPIVDAWKPPAPPPPVLRTIPVAASFGPVANERRLILDSIDFYDDLMAVNYRLRPGERDDDESVHFLWGLEVEDDVGTEYDIPSGAYGGDQDEIHGGLDVHPAPPPAAERLTLIVVDDSGDDTDEPESVGYTTIELRP